MKKVFKWIGIVFGVLLIISIIGALLGKKETSAKAIQQTNTNTDSTSIAKSDTAASTAWQYSIDSSDKMNNSKMHYAQCEATEKVDFKFPYDGGSTANLTIRYNSKNKNEVIVSVDKGQFMSGSDQSVAVKFDNDKPQSFNYSEAADGSSNYIFINNSATFINRIKSAKHIIIEAQFFNNGTKQIEFNTKDLAWNY